MNTNRNRVFLGKYKLKIQYLNKLSIKILAFIFPNKNIEIRLQKNLKSWSNIKSQRKKKIHGNYKRGITHSKTQLKPLLKELKRKYYIDKFYIINNQNINSNMESNKQSNQ